MSELPDGAILTPDDLSDWDADDLVILVDRPDRPPPVLCAEQFARLDILSTPRIFFHLTP